MKTLRIFISSPSDVRAERVRAYDVIQRLQTKFRAFIKIEPILWEEEPMRATASFQAQIPRPSESDIVVCVLWAKIGTRLPQDYKRADGSVPTGTEWEFEDAYEAFKTRGTPDLLVYRKTAPPSITVTSKEMLREWERQKEALDAFLDRWFRDHQGAFQAAFTPFETDEEFEERLSTHLEKVISVKLERPETITWTEGSPFRGLDIFQAKHEKIFFGRDLAIAEITERMIEQSSRGRVFLIVLGMSGCGKSSLVRAGVLPELMRPGVVKEIGCWRWAILRPSEAGGTLTEGLAAALLREGSALPELGQSGYDVQRLAKLLRDAPTHALPPLEAALGRAAEQLARETLRSKPPEARLILIIDQLEEMFTLERFDDAQRAAFIGGVSALSQSGLVWVIATMRSDLYGYCAEVEEFRALKGDDGQYDLIPPGVSEIGQIIRMPAMAAGLDYEVHPTTHEKLDDALQEEASKNPGALPLLEFCLDELYKLRTESRLITWDAYETLGRLNGAIAKRAEDVFAALSPAGQEAFPKVLAALVTMEADATSRPARRKEIVAISGAEEVVAAFTQANLFVTDADQAGEPVVAVAHEALIKSWPRVQEWVGENKDFLRLKTRIAQAAHRWRESGRDKDFLLPEGKALAEAEDALQKYREQIEDVEFVQSSIDFVNHRKKVRRVWAGVGLTAVLSVIFGFLALRQVQRQEEHDALTAEGTSAADEMDQNEIPASLAYLADVLKKDPTDEKATALTVAELRDSPLPTMTLTHHGEVQDAAFSPDGARIVTASADKTAQLWDAQSGAPIGKQPMTHDGWVHTAKFSLNGKEVVTGSWDGTARVWDAYTGSAITAKPMGQIGGGKIADASLSPDGSEVVTASYDKVAQIWDARTGNQIGDTMGHLGTVWTARFSPDGTRIVTASADGTAKVWDAHTGTIVGTLAMHKDEVNVADFSPDGKWIVTGSDDSTAIIWDAKKLTSAAVLQHAAAVNYVGFSHEARTQFVVTASSDDTAHMWDLSTGKPHGQAMRHSSRVRSAEFSKDDKWIVTASYDRTARVWNAQTGLAETEPMRHSGAVYVASFDPQDSSELVTASFDGTAQIWKWHETKTLPEMVEKGEIKSTCFDSEDGVIATVSTKAVMVWDSRTGQAAHTGVPPVDDMKIANCSPDSKSLATVSSDGVQLRSAKTSEPAGPVITAPDSKKIERINLGSDDHSVLIITASDLFLRDGKSGQLVNSFHPGGNIILMNAALSPDGHEVAAYTDEGKIYIWNVLTGKPVAKDMAHEGRIASIRFSPDTKWLVTASADHSARTWNAETGEAGVTLKHDDWVNDAVFSPDGKWIVTACANSTARVWDARTGEPVSELMRHKDEVLTASFSQNSLWVLTTSKDGTAKVWDARTGVAVSEPMSYDDGRMGESTKIVSASFSPDGEWILTVFQYEDKDKDGNTWEARIWDSPITTPKAPAWLSDIAEKIGGSFIDGRGVLQSSRAENAIEIRHTLDGLAGTDDVSRFGRWLSADPATRPLSPRGN